MNPFKGTMSLKYWFFTVFMAANLYTKRRLTCFNTNDEDVKMYSINKHSFLNFLGYTERSQNIGILRKFNHWKHKFPWAENFMRNSINTSISYLFLRHVAKGVMSWVKHWWYEDSEESADTILDWKYRYIILADILIYSGICLYRSSRCIKGVISGKK